MAGDVFERVATMAPKSRDAIEMWTRSLSIQQSRDSTLATPANVQELIGAAHSAHHGASRVSSRWSASAC